MQDSKTELGKISRQFLCNVPFKEFDWEEVSNFTLNDQEILVNHTVNSKLILQYPIKIEYQKTFIKHLLDKLEKREIEIHDDLYTAYGRLVSLLVTDETQFYKHYVINDKTIILKENINLISEGTTGLRTWQASLALGEWAVQNEEFFNNKNVLELGSGVGLAGLIISMLCAPKNFYFTDCHPSVLNTLQENVNLNVNFKISDLKHLNQTGKLDKTLENTNLRVLNLPWEDVDEKLCKQIGKLDNVVAADVIYDSEIFLPLLNALKCLFTYCGVKSCILACTERNKNTLEEFLKLVEMFFVVVELTTPQPKHLIWSNETPIRMFELTQSRTSSLC